MKLIYTATNRADFSPGREVAIGDKVVTFRGECATVIAFAKPLHRASTGRVTIGASDERWTMDYFPSVIGAEWVEREDRA